MEKRGSVAKAIEHITAALGEFQAVMNEAPKDTLEHAEAAMCYQSLREALEEIYRSVHRVVSMRDAEADGW